MNQENLKLEDTSGTYIYFLILNNTSSFTLDWEVSAVFRLFLLNQNQENYCVVQDIMGKERRFNGLKHVWGFDKFIPLRAFNDASNGYLVEDTCVFEAEVLVKERNKFKEISISCIINNEFLGQSCQ
ncbi:hypothetical protein KPL71_015073 [Citrus sinensis]|uniref:Uncharacterized protein n=1 Tax=Citrus sinensis TaxID=2711 RepID=A0ACB8KGI7_CITSI|nr:hypothetical protein KPL71_015073 [Citrus sinensis]